MDNNENSKGLDQVYATLEYIKEVNRALLQYQRNEWRYEMSIQMTIGLTMLLLVESVTQTTTSTLEAVFKEDS